MATKRPRRPRGDGKAPRPRKKKRKMRLSLRQNKIKKSDNYTDSIGWSQNTAGRVLGDVEKPKELETLTIQCDMCGSMLKIRKPSRARYSVTCTYPECGNVMNFD